MMYNLKVRGEKIDLSRQVRRALFGPKVNEFVPQSQNVNLRIVCQQIVGVPNSPRGEHTHTSCGHAPLEAVGGLRTFHRKTTYPNAIDFKALCNIDLVTLPPGIWGNETSVVH